MPYWPTYGEILYIDVGSTFDVTIHKVRTNLPNNIQVKRGFLAMFVNDMNKWNYIASINKTLFLASFN